MPVKRRFRFPLLRVGDVSVLFLILGIAIGTTAAAVYQISMRNVPHGGAESLLGKRVEQMFETIASGSPYRRIEGNFSGRWALFFQVWLQRAGFAWMLWLAGMTPLSYLAAWGCSLLLGTELALLLAGFTAWGGIWGLPVFGATLFPQILCYLPVCLLLFSWAFARERRVRMAGFLILLSVIGFGAAMEVWICPVLVRFLVSHGPF